MKIALLAPSAAEGSSSPIIYLKYARTMAARGHDVTALFSHRLKLPVEDHDRFRLRFCPKWLMKLSSRGGFGIGELVYKCLYLLMHRFDCVQVCAGHRPANLIPAVLSKWVTGSVVVEEWWEWYGKGGCGDLRKGFAGACVRAYDSLLEVRSKYAYDGIIVISSELRDHLRRHPAVSVFHGGAEIDALTDYDLCESRQMLGLDKGLLVLGMSGLTRNDHADNMPFFEAIRASADEFPHVRLLATGDSKYIMDSVRPLLPPGVLINVGWVEFPTYNRYLSACDAFALPLPNTRRNRSRWPNKIGDFLVLDRPIVTNPTGDVAALFAEYRLGYLCDNTSEAYQGIIRKIAEREDHAWQSRDVARLLSFDVRVDKILEFYERLQINRREKAH